MDFNGWLDRIGLGRYAELFAENRIDLDVLPDLTESDLERLGIPLGDRKRLLKAAASGLAQSAAPSPRAGPPGRAPESERRQLTVMFCDLVESTSLSAQMDPEEYREVLAAYRSAASSAIRDYDGYIARYLGDGLLVYFGYPHAHEDDPERAVRSGLDIIDAIGALKPRTGVELRVRIGIATGLVVAGDIVVEGASEERAVIGDTPNLAARLQEMAEPNSAVLSESTRRLVEGRFVLEPLESRTLKGFKGPVPAYRAVAVAEVTRFQAAASGGLTRLTGRESELALLQQRWERAKLGEGQTVLLGGEPGIGKSRLIEELRERVGTGASTVLRYQCSPYHTGSAFHPFIGQLQRAAEFDPDDSPEARRRKLEAFVGDSLPGVENAVALLSALLSLPLAPYPALEMTPQRQKAETIRVLVGLIASYAFRGPVLMDFEDAHWIDPSSREVLGAVIDRIQSLRMLCLVTYRPEFSPPWRGLGHVTTHTLNRLGRQEVGGMVDSLTGGKTLPAELLARILDRTDGVPLFVEELTKTLLDSGILEEAAGHYALARPLGSLSIPATLHDSLLARLDRLADTKEVAQTAACIGREFSTELLAAVSAQDWAALDDALEKMVDAQLVFRREEGVPATYRFKHALVQDAAYESLLVSTRQKLHARIAHVLEERFPEIIGSEPERLAQHYTAANMAGQAIPCWLAAGRRALSASNLPEAISHLSKALELTATIDDAAGRAEYELEVRTTLGAATTALHGWPAREVHDVVKPACDLFEQGYGGADAFINLWKLWAHHGCRAEHREGLSVVDRMLNHSNQRKDPLLSLISSFTAAMAHLWMGNFDSAIIHESAALELYKFERDKNLVWHYNHDPKNTLLSWASLRAWALGYPDKARVLSDEAVAHARRVGHPFNLCWTLGNSSIAYGNCGDFEKALARIEELRRVAEEEELTFMQVYMAPVATSMAAARQGAHQTAYDEGVRAENAWRAIGGRFWSPVVRACMAQACLELGRCDEARDLIDGTIEQIDSTGELMLAEEIYRIAGLVYLRQSGNEQGAEALFERSLRYSKEHSSKSFELRTSMSLARLWRNQGKRQEARDLLAPVVNWFTEGFDTADVMDARMLLGELS